MGLCLLSYLHIMTTSKVSYVIELKVFTEFLYVAQFLEIPGSLKDSQLHVWPGYPKRPTSFAWMTGAGVYCGQLGFGDHEPGESLFLDKELIPYCGASEQPSELTPPMGMALTQFHCLLFYRDRSVSLHLPPPFLRVALPPSLSPLPPPPLTSTSPLPSPNLHIICSAGWKLFVVSIKRECLKMHSTPG